MSAWVTFDASAIQVTSVNQRETKSSLEMVRPLPDPADLPAFESLNPEIVQLAQAVRLAKQQSKPVIVFLSGQVVKYGLSLFIIDLIEKGYITHLAGNGSVLMHDWGLLYDGQTSEDVERYLGTGQFGLWTTPYLINDAFRRSHQPEWSIGQTMQDAVKYRVPWRPVGLRASLLSACVRNKIPFTFHILAGGDINHMHPNFSPSYLEASYYDFLVLARAVDRLDDGGVYINIGTQVTGVETFLKSLSMSRNVRAAKGRPLTSNFTTGLLDYVRLPEHWRDGEASEGDAVYYYRPYKTLLLRSIALGGQSFYGYGPHTETVPQLWQAITQAADTPASPVSS